MTQLTISNFVFSEGGLVITDYFQNLISPPARERRRRARRRGEGGSE